MNINVAVATNATQFKLSAVPPKTPPIPDPIGYDETFIQTVLEPRIFKSLESFCREAIAYGSNVEPLRQGITRIILDMRKTAQAKYGHDTPDIVALVHLLKRTSTNEKEREPPRKTRADPLWELYQSHKLDEDQVNSARKIQEIWAAFGRYLTIASRNYWSGGGSARKGRVLQPLDVMSDETYDLWKTCYCPWYDSLKNQTIHSSTVGPISLTGIVFRILIEEYHPDQLDNAFRFEVGMSLKILKAQLDRFSTAGETYTGVN